MLLSVAQKTFAGAVIPPHTLAGYLKFSVFTSQDYTVPDFFSESDDFLTGLDDDLRLDWRWIIMAAKRSGSGWHVDPANTTGWLALVQGAKLWGMYPPSVYHIPGERSLSDP